MCHSILKINHNFEKLIVTITKPHACAQLQWISVALRNPVTCACCVLWINVRVDFDLTMNIISNARKHNTEFLNATKIHCIS